MINDQAPRLSFNDNITEFAFPKRTPPQGGT